MRAKLLHANFVVAVLSDLFGIQARSGCFCAGPYIHRLYPIDDDWSARMSAETEKGHLGALLAFTRLSFNYFISEAAFTYVVEAVNLLAREGWKLLPLYRFDPESGLWHHRAGTPRSQTSLREALHATSAGFATAPDSVLADQFDAARQIITAVQANPPRARFDDPVVSEEFQRIRWFPLPGEGLAQLRSGRDVRGSSYEATGAGTRTPKRTRWTIASIGRSSARP
jgi:hypothetical protein